MDIYKEFEGFCSEHNLTVQEALGKIAVIRSYRPDTMKPKYKNSTRKKQTRSPAYLNFIREIPCIGCGEIKTTKAVLFNNKGNPVRARASDYSALPLCNICKHDEGVLLSIRPRLEILQLKFLQTYLRCIEGT